MEKNLKISNSNKKELFCGAQMLISLCQFHCFLKIVACIFGEFENAYEMSTRHCRVVKKSILYSNLLQWDLYWIFLFIKKLANTFVNLNKRKKIQNRRKSVKCCFPHHNFAVFTLDKGTLKRIFITCSCNNEKKNWIVVFR